MSAVNCGECLAGHRKIMNEKLDVIASLRAENANLRRCGNCRKWNPLNHECYDNAAYETYITERNHTCEKWELQP